MQNIDPNTQLSSKVNSDTLDLMYNNFTKIVDWLIRGKQSQFPMPGALGQAIEVLPPTTSPPKPSLAPKLPRSTLTRCAQTSPLCWRAWKRWKPPLLPKSPSAPASRKKKNRQKLRPRRRVLSRLPPRKRLLWLTSVRLPRRLRLHRRPSHSRKPLCSPLELFRRKCRPSYRPTPTRKLSV